MGLTNFPNGITSMGIPIMGGGPPPIPGTYYHVNPRIGSNGNKGTDSNKPLASIVKAEDLLTTNVGDGIMVWSQGNTSANTTSYLSSALTFDKNGCVVYGVHSGTMVAGRARVANASGSNTLANMITISGSNNAFYNLHVANYGSGAAALGCIDLTGNRNYFQNCHFAGGGHATPAAETGMYSLKLQGEENTFESCVIGLDSITRAAANAEILIDGGATRNIFRNCYIISFSDTAGKLAVKVADTTAIDRFLIFDNCIFYNFSTNHSQTLTAAFSVPASTQTHDIILKDCMAVGYAEWEANDRGQMFMNMDTPTAEDGGIAVEPVNT